MSVRDVPWPGAGAMPGEVGGGFYITPGKEVAESQEHLLEAWREPSP